MGTPLISIIVPVYNVEKYLDSCLKSVTAQIYTPLEIILVDDGSKDASGAVCDRWAEWDHRIRVIHKENGGPSQARNTGLDEAKGEYVMFVDSDDVVDSHICQHLYDNLVADQAEIAICEQMHLFGEEAPEFTLVKERQVFDARSAIEELWYQRSFLPGPCAKLYKKELFRRERFAEDMLYYEDVDIMHRLFWQAKRITYTHSQLYGYIHREGSITNYGFTQRDTAVLTVADRMLTFAAENDESLLSAAKSYSVVAALRVELNAPKTAEFDQAHARAQELLRVYGKNVLRDKNIRKKTYLGLVMYFYCRPLMPVVYKRINRWK